MSDKLTDAEIKELQDKKKQIREELYDQVKMEMFKASSALEPKDDMMIDEKMQVPAEQGITPDSWVILEVNHEGEQFQKVLAGWSGGYLHGDSWRLSSPIKSIDITIGDDKLVVYTESGSCYNLYKGSKGLRMSIAGIYNQLKENYGDKVVMVDL